MKENTNNDVKKENKRLQYALEESISGIIVLDFKGKITFVNENWANIHGYKINELLEKPFSIVTENQKDTKSFLKRVEKKKTVLEETTHIRKNKEKVPLLLRMTLLKDKNKRNIGFTGSCLDLTEQKDREEEYKRLYETSQDAIMVLDPSNGKFLKGNPSTVRLFECKNEEEFITYRPDQLSPKNQPNGITSLIAAKEKIQTAMKEGSAYFEWVHKTTKGRIFPVTVLLTRYTIRGKELVQATVRDITEKKKAQDEAQKLNDLTVDREIKMIELKKEINELLKMEHLKPKYKIVG